jgi:hypothetical protein
VDGGEESGWFEKNKNMQSLPWKVGEKIDNKNIGFGSKMAVKVGNQKS